MKILLIKARQIVPNSKNNHPSGIMCLSAALKQAGYRDIRGLYLEVEPKPLEKVESVLNDYKPDIVGISALTAEGKSMFEIAALSKRVLPQSLVVMGGPHPTASPEECLQKGGDLVARGEGEITIVELVKAREEGRGFEGIKGLVYKDSSGAVKFNEPRPFIEDLDCLPFPDWDLFDNSPFTQLCLPIRFAPFMTFFTARGCPYHCVFCHNIMGKKFRAHSPQRVLAEIDALYARGIKHFEIWDDIFNFDRERAAEIMRLIIKRGKDINLYFPNGVRGDILDEELIELFAKAGTRFITIAVESASPRIQRDMKKYINLPKAKEIIAICAKKKIYTSGFFIIGFPDETLPEALKTCRFILSSRLHSYLMFNLFVFRGTELGDARLPEKAISVNTPMSASHRFSYGQNVSRMSAATTRVIKFICYMLFLMSPLRIYRVYKVLDCSPSVFLRASLRWFWATICLKDDWKPKPLN